MEGNLEYGYGAAPLTWQHLAKKTARLDVEDLTEVDEECKYEVSTGTYQANGEGWGNSDGGLEWATKRHQPGINFLGAYCLGYTYAGEAADPSLLATQ